MTDDKIARLARALRSHETAGFSVEPVVAVALGVAGLEVNRAILEALRDKPEHRDSLVNMQRGARQTMDMLRRLLAFAEALDVDVTEALGARADQEHTG